MSALKDLGLDPIDRRPDRAGWKYGAWWRQCVRCRHHFLGSMQATECAPCVYGDR